MKYGQLELLSRMGRVDWIHRTYHSFATSDHGSVQATYARAVDQDITGRSLDRLMGRFKSITEKPNYTSCRGKIPRNTYIVPVYSNSVDLGISVKVFELVRFRFIL